MPRLFLRIFAIYWLSLVVTVVVWKLVISSPLDASSDAWFFGSRFVVAVMISVGACLLATHYITEPVRALRAAARAIAEGNLTARAATSNQVKLPRNDELRALVRDFNHMAARLEAFVFAQEQIVRDASHELRAPLARLSLGVDLLGQSEDMHEQRQRIQRDVQRLNTIVDRFLLVLRLDAETELPAHEWFDLEDLVLQVLEESGIEAADRGCTLTAVHVESCTVRGDFELLRSAIENVVRNAIVHTGRGTVVQVSLARAESENVATVVVEDNGPGLATEQLSSIFRPFYRGDRRRSSESGGFGLGLAIAQRVVNLHGGATVARNRGAGRGLRVEMRIPLARE